MFLHTGAALRGGAAPPTPAEVEPVVFFNPSSYANTAALLADTTIFDPVKEELSNGGAAGAVAAKVLDDAVAPPISGATKSMRYDFNHGANGCTSIVIGRGHTFPAAQQAWAEFYVKWSTNFTTANAACPPNDHKLIFGDTEDDESGRWAFYVGADSPPFHSIMVERPLSSLGFPGAYYCSENNDPVAETVWLSDTWHIIRLFYRNSTTPSSADGAMKVWLDGTLIHNEAGFNTQKVAGGAEKINGFSYCHNKDDGPANTLMHIWWGQTKIWTQQPSWAA